MFILWIFAKIFYFRENFCENIAKFRFIFAFRKTLLEKHKIFPKFYVYFINFRKNFREAKFRKISLNFHFSRKLKKAFSFQP